ncbi:MAG TPA: hypothetical protein VIU62_13675, partial [Chloroflexota bacterium]
PITAVAPAIGNAIFAASGIRLCALPMLPTGLLPLPSQREANHECRVQPGSERVAKAGPTNTLQ